MSIQEMQADIACQTAVQHSPANTNKITCSAGCMEQQRRFSIRANSLQPNAAFTLDGYVNNLHAIAAALTAAGVRVALMTLPPIGEDLGSSVNARVFRAARQGSTHMLVPY